MTVVLKYERYFGESKNVRRAWKISSYVTFYHPRLNIALFQDSYHVLYKIYLSTGYGDTSKFSIIEITIPETDMR